MTEKFQEDSSSKLKDRNVDNKPTKIIMGKVGLISHTEIADNQM
jgi:hypothetical protein